MNRDSFLGLVKRRLTLRTRLALWVTGLLLLFSIVLLVLINVAIPIKTTDYPVKVGMTMSIPGNQTMVISPKAWIITDTQTSNKSDEITYKAPSGTPDAVTITFPPSSIEKLTGVTTSSVRKNVFHEMRVVSFIGLGIVVLLGGLVAYWLAGRALRPVRSLAQAARGIDAETLDTRLNSKGPEDELRQLSDSFDSMLNRLESAFEQQGRFVADAAHELRTPLTTLRSNLDVVRADPKATVEDYREMTSTLERALTRLQRVVDDLLLLATEERSISDTPVIVEPLVEEALSDLKPLANEYSVNLKYESNEINNGLIINGNSELLARVFHNLIENGIRYNKTGGEVVVKTAKEGEFTVVTVKDTGVGIAPEQLHHIFDRFYRTDSSRARNNGGAGLGLSIVAYILHLHKGQIEVESTPGVGTTFIVKLPLSVKN